MICEKCGKPMETTACPCATQTKLLGYLPTWRISVLNDAIEKFATDMLKIFETKKDGRDE